MAPISEENMHPASVPPNPNELWFMTRSGIKFYPARPRPEDVSIADIASALAKTARFNGHTFEFYSVAQHSGIVADTVKDARYKREALLHDAAEAYTGDLIRPIKVQPGLAGFREIEERIERVIAERFGLIYPWPGEIKEADLLVLYTEDRDLRPSAWHDRPTLPERIVPAPWETAYGMFMAHWRELNGGKE
ncbi:MAG: phosphohydrolase [Acidobacteria bacterium]|nr:phosphohydrolase [Acidobacteriota bacterium]